MPAPSNAEFIDALQKVHEFYNDSFTSLQTLMLGLVGIIGVVLPLLISFYQNRRLRQETSSLKKEIAVLVSAAATSEFERLEERVREELDKSIKDAKREVAETRKKMEKALSRATGGVLHVQANAELRDGHHIAGARSLLGAVRSYVDAEDYLNLRAVCNTLTSIALERVSKFDFENDPDLDGLLSECIKRLETPEQIRYNADLLHSIKKAANAVKARVFVPQATPSL